MKFEAICLMMGGVALLFVAMDMLTNIAITSRQTKLRQIFCWATKNNSRGFGAGVFSAVGLQSSGAASVLLQSMVTADMIPLHSITPIIMGMNVGTTITVLVLALPVAESMCAMCLICYFAQKMCRGESTKTAFQTGLAVGLVFLALQILCVAPAPFYGTIASMFGKNTNNILIMLTGVFASAVLGSGSAVLAIIIGSFSTGADSVAIIPVLYAIVGVNIGTCSTAIISSVGGSYAAKCVAYIHLAFNTLGCVVFCAIFAFPSVCHYVEYKLFAGISPHQAVPIFHIFYNAIATLFTIPFSKQFTRLVCAGIKKTPSEKTAFTSVV